MMFVRLIVLPALSLGGIALAAYTVRAGNTPPPPSVGLTTPANSPYTKRVSATGVVEARSRNIGLGIARPGVVTAMPHDIGSAVAAGDLLLQIDDRDAQARLAARKAELVSARQELARLRALPRPEDVAPRRAVVEQRSAQLQDAANLLAMAQGVADPRAMSKEEVSRRQAAVAVQQAALDEARAQLTLIEAGAWQQDIDLAQARIAIAEAAVQTAEQEIAQLRVVAPFAGKVLQVNVRVGEYAAAGQQQTAAIVLGDTTVLHVRADIDEMDVWRLRPEAKAMAFVRGNPTLGAPLQFVAVEPLMIPKRSLSGSSREQVDTRVLQVLYALDPKALPVQVGQLVDVSIEALEAPHAQTSAPAATAPQGSGK